MGAWRSTLTAAVVLSPVYLTGPAAAFTPGRYVVHGTALVKARGGAQAGQSVSVFAKPVAVTVDGCGSRNARVKSRRRAVRVAVTLVCGKQRGALKGVIRGSRLRGAITRGGHRRKFAATRVAPRGALLRGGRNGSALAAVRDTDALVRHAAGEVSAGGRLRVLRTELALTFARAARIKSVNAALTAAGGRIAGAIHGLPELVVAIPDPGTVAVLDRLRALLARMPGIARVSLSLMPQADDIPSGFGLPPATAPLDDLRQLLVMRMPAAWNARTAIVTGQQPLVIVADFFGNGALDDSHVAATYSPTFLTTGTPNTHGYHVTGIIAGNFAQDGSQPGLVTGVFPGTTVLEPLDLTGYSIADIDKEMALIAFAAKVASGHVVVNTSLGFNGGGMPAADAQHDGSAWATAIRALGLEGRMVQATSAGNDGISAVDNSPWTAAVLRHDLRDPTTNQPIGPLDNTMVVENSDDTGSPDYLPGCRWAGGFENSNIGGTISGVGIQVYSNFTGAGAPPAPGVFAGTASGTSMSSPEAAGLAEYLWSIAPGLTAQQVVQAILQNAAPVPAGCPDNPPTRHLDAYASVLSLDQPGAQTKSGAPVRFAILDANHDGVFDQTDIKAFLDAFDATNASGARDWSAFDLNGDGFTGGPATAPLDLDTTGSTFAGAPTLGNVTETINKVPIQFDEKAQTDLSALCYYAYSGFYTAAASGDQRDALLGNRCVPAGLVNASAVARSDSLEDDEQQVTRLPQTGAAPFPSTTVAAVSPQASEQSFAGTSSASSSGTLTADATLAKDGTLTLDASGHAEGSATATSTAPFPDCAEAIGRTDVNTDVTFVVKAQTAYTYNGSGSGSGNIHDVAVGLQQLKPTARTIFTAGASGPAATGTLTPGTYHFASDGFAGGAAGPVCDSGPTDTTSGSADFNTVLALTPASPGPSRRAQPVAIAFTAGAR